jgi:hypothetical protein
LTPIKLSNWGWLIVLGGGFVLLVSGVSATRYVQSLVEPPIEEDCIIDRECIALFDSAAVIDIDSEDFNGGQLTIGFTENTETDNDFLGIRSQIDNPDGVFVKGDKVFYGGVDIGVLSFDEETEKLIVSFNERMTQEAASVLLRSISYWNILEEPQLGNRKVEVLLSDGDGDSSKPVLRTISVVAENAPTSIQATNNLTVKSNSDLVISGVRVQDSDSQKLSVTFSVSSGILTIQSNLEGGLNSESIKNNGSNSVTLEGTIEQINNTLSKQNTFKYRPNQDFIGNDFLSITATDSGSADSGAEENRLLWPATATLDNVATQEVDITVNPANAPTISMSTLESLAVDEDQKLSLGSIEIVDPDSQNIFVGLQAEVGNLTLTGNVPEGLNVENQVINNLDTIVLSGNTQQVNAFLTGSNILTYQGPQDFFGTDYINLIAYDGSNYSNLGLSITVSPVNDPPDILLGDSTDQNGGNGNDDNPKPTPPPPGDVTNATITGDPTYTKNVRAGIEGDKLFELPVGSRVQILESRYNSDNFLWYKIYSPDFDREGWIAGHLVEED